MMQHFDGLNKAALLPPIPGTDRVLALAMEDCLHDLSQPLTSIVCAFELLGTDGLPAAQQKQVLQMAQNESQRLVSKVNDLRDAVQQIFSYTAEFETRNRKDVA